MSAARNIKGKIKKLSKALAKLYRNEVIKQDLIDTGLMRDSFTVVITVDKNGSIEILVNTVYYFPFIDESPHYFKVSENIFKSKEYLKIEDKLVTLIAVGYALSFPSGFTASDSVSYSFLEPTGKFYKGGQFMPGGKRAPKGGIQKGR